MSIEVQWCREDDCPNVAGTDGLCRTHRKKAPKSSVVVGLDDFVRRLVADAPPLTAKQRDEISMLIHRKAPR